MSEWVIIKRNLMRMAMPVLTALAIFGTLAGSNEPVIGMLQDTWIADISRKLHIGNTILFNLSVGFLVSLFFWFLVVRVPELRKRAILKRNLTRQYQYFKEDVIQILLFAAASTYDSELVKKLTDYREFKRYFSENQNAKWYDALNGLQSDTDYLNDLLVEVELLADEISYVLNNIAIDDEEVHFFFKRLSTHVYRLKNASIYTSDHAKYLGNFVWELLARWSMVDGQRKEDIVQDMIDKI